MREKDKKKEREELYRNWMKWTIEEESGEYLDALGKKLSETIENKLKEMFQEE